jgi:hypothetical protein
LEYLAVGGAGEEPEPGNDFGTVIAEALVAAHARETAHKAIPMPLVIARMLDRDCHLLANDILERNRMIFREKLNYEMKWLGDPFTSTEGLQEKNIFTQWSLYTNDSMFLGVRHQ